MFTSLSGSPNGLIPSKQDPFPSEGCNEAVKPLCSGVPFPGTCQGPLHFVPALHPYPASFLVIPCVQAGRPSFQVSQ